MEAACCTLDSVMFQLGTVDAVVMTESIKTPSVLLVDVCRD